MDMDKQINVVSVHKLKTNKNTRCIWRFGGITSITSDARFI